MSRTRAVLTALLLLSALGLAGCSDDDPKPKFAPPSSEPPTSPSTSAASRPVEPAFPAEARGTDAASAEAFVQFYWEMVNYAQTSGEVHALRELGATDCTACKAGVSYLEDVFNDGGRITGGVGTLEIKRSSLVQGDGEMNAVVKFVLSSTPQRVDYPGDGKDEKYAGGRSIVNALLKPARGSWIVSSWGVQE